ncbi:COX15/CtaA family protein [Crocinitomix catalasitica]|uniref:COX15/CtaA family protein n=1 Tax=Crocinitomix catalasitica TaxID=184607 RepID=UPI00048374CE|nr:COX15/CtaA family protein [Crocinitomix catalasitica]
MSKGYRRLTWITLIFIFLVTLAGSIVRTTGSGMGCPDWPKCFDQIIPPTSADQLPDNYKEKFVEGRKEKVQKFAGVLESIGFTEKAEQLRNDPNLWHEEDFNAARTWTEYGNRLVGFVAGNLVLILFIWTLIKYRNHKLLVLLTFLNLILMGFEGWLGSIVVATNLVPWTITLHMFFALIIIGMQFKIIHLAEENPVESEESQLFNWLCYFALFLTFIQIILGAQVRQEIDFLVMDDVHRADWIATVGRDFLFHRSFSWVILTVNLFIWWINRKKQLGFNLINIIVMILILEFITGVLFSYANMPAIIQPLHLLLAAILIGIQFYLINKLKIRIK